MIEILTDADWESFLESGTRVLLIGKAECPACQVWGSELTAALMDEGVNQPPGGALPLGRLPIRWGKITLDRGPLTQFKREHGPWLMTLKDLPHNSIWMDGIRLKEWPGGGMERLRSRLIGLGLMEAT
jgi:hypothetical protein